MTRVWRVTTSLTRCCAGAAFSASVSLNAAMFVSVLLASRSPSNLHVYLLMCAAVEVFALAPRVYRQAPRLSPPSLPLPDTLPLPPGTSAR